MEQKSKNILIFTTAFKPLIGGSEIAIEEIGKRLKGINFIVITPRYSIENKKSEVSDNFFVYRLGIGKLLDKFMFPATGLLKGSSVLDNQKITAVHSYQASFGGLAALFIKLLRPETKFLLTLQEGKDLDKQNWLIRFLRSTMIKRADVITAISSYLADYVKKINPQVEVLTIPNGVDPGLFKMVDQEEIRNLKSDLGINDGDKVIVTVSRLVPKNGVLDLIDAVPELKKSFSSIHLLIIGSGPLKNEIEKKTKKLGLRDNVKMLGDINYASLAKYLSLADIFVRPSVSEGLGNAFLEAMAVGIPVLGTPVGGITDFLKDGETGYLWDRSKESLADKIFKCLEDIRLKEVAAKGRNLVLEKYSWDSIAEKFNDLYNRI